MEPKGFFENLDTMKTKTIYFNICVMMFMQYLLFAVWWVPLAAYLSKTLQLEVWQVSLILSSMAIGSMTSPFIGIIADRYFRSERVLAVLNLLSAALLFLAGRQTSFAGLFITITLVMLCYMPTWSLTSSVAMTHIPAEQFPRVRLMGSLGWVASGLFSLAAMYIFKMEAFDGTAYPIYCGIGAATVAAVLNLTLPKTPPKGERTSKISIKDILGLRVISSLGNRNFNIFILVSFLAIIPFTLYHVYGSMFFAEENVRNITITMNWGQAAEIVFLFFTTTIMVKFGFKKAMIFGLSAMLLRYGSFWLGVEADSQWLYSVGVLTHGLIFGLFFVVGQVYTDKIAPPELRAQAQGFLSFSIWGVGYLIGTLGNGALIDRFRSGESCDWAVLFMVAAVTTLVLALIFGILFRNPSKEMLTKKSGM